jgi:hypothetical protein
LGSKVTLLLRYLESSSFTSSDLILFSDSTDVIFQASWESIESAIAQAMAIDQFHSILVSGEHDIWPPSFAGHYRNYQQSDTYARNKQKINRQGVGADDIGFYRGLNSGSLLGRASRLLPLLRFLASERPSFHPHHLVYSPSGVLTAEGERSITVSGPLRHPDSRGEGVQEYTIPGVYKRNDQITTAMAFYQQTGEISSDDGEAVAVPDPGVVPPEGTNFGLVVDEHASLFQTMQLSTEQVVRLLAVTNGNTSLRTLDADRNPLAMSAQDSTAIAATIKQQLLSLPFWKADVLASAAAEGSSSHSPLLEDFLHSVVDTAIKLDSRLVQKKGADTAAASSGSSSSASSFDTPALVHYNGPSKVQSSFGAASYARVVQNFFWRQEEFIRASARFVDACALVQQIGQGHREAPAAVGTDGLVSSTPSIPSVSPSRSQFQFRTRRMLLLPHVDVLHMCPALVPWQTHECEAKA